MYKTIVNGIGHVVELCVVERGGEFLDYALPDGCTAVSYLNDSLTETNGVQHPPLKPRWDFGAGAWVDEATAAELEEAYPAAQPESTIEDTTLDLLVDHEFRLCMLELGI